MCRLKKKKICVVLLVFALSLIVIIFMHRYFINESPVVSSIEWKMYDVNEPKIGSLYRSSKCPTII